MDNQNNDQESQAPGQPAAPGIITPDNSGQAETPQRPEMPQVISSDQKPKRKWKKPLIILLVILVLAGVGAYLYKKNTKSESSNSATSQNKDIPLMRVGLWNVDFGKLYPDISTNEYSFMTNTQMFEGLVRYEQKNKIVPNLATDWTNPDSKTWLFNIDASVKFHDGHTLTANDVKYSLDKIRANKSSDFTSTFASTISSVTVVSDSKVKIVTTEPDPTLLNKLAFLYIIDANLPKGDEPSQAGTGAYEIKPGTKPNGTDVQMVAFDGYHKGRPTTRELSFHSEKDKNTLLTALKDGKYDIAGTVSTDDVAKNPNTVEFVSSEPDVHFLAFNLSMPGPLQNKKVREAIRYAVDPVAIGKARGNLTTPLSQMVPESIPGYNPSIPPYKQDTEKAKKLLAEAGYPNGVTIRYSTSDTDRANQEVTKELKAAGITLTVDLHANFDEFIDYFLSGKTQMYTIDYSSDTLDGVDVYRTTLASPNYDNPKFTKLLDEASNTVDPAQRLKLLQDAAVIIDQDIPVVPLSTEDDLWLMNKDYDIVQDMPSSYLSVYFYKTQLK